MFLYKCLCRHSVFYFLGCISRIAGSYSNSILSLLTNYQTVFQSDSTILHSRHSCMRGPGSPHPQQHLLLPVFFTLTILVDMMWYLVVLICISLMADDCWASFHVLLGHFWPFYLILLLPTTHNFLSPFIFFSP